jgi:cysteine desulfurase
MLSNVLYFDHNATTPLLPQARQAWLDACDDFPANPSSPHRLGARADAALQHAREKLASLLGCDPVDIVWTSGATESNNTPLHHIACSASAEAEVWISAIEHPCLLQAATKYFPKRRRLIPVLGSGVLNVDWLETELERQRPALVAVMAANNETGVLQPWRKVLDLCRQRQVPFLCDAVQWMGKLPAAGLGQCDFVSGSAHKFGGPRGAGFLKCPSAGRFHPLLVGGAQEEGRRAGTENVPGVLSMMAALDTCEDLRAENQQRLGWKKNFETQLVEALPGTEILGAGEERLWNTVSALMPADDCRRRWVVKLDKLGFAVSTGSACASGREEPSHVLQAMGYRGTESGRVLRFSSGWQTSEADWNGLLAALMKVAGSQ